MGGSQSREQLASTIKQISSPSCSPEELCKAVSELLVFSDSAEIVFEMLTPSWTRHLPPPHARQILSQICGILEGILGRQEIAADDISTVFAAFRVLLRLTPFLMENAEFFDQEISDRILRVTMLSLFKPNLTITAPGGRSDKFPTDRVDLDAAWCSGEFSGQSTVGPATEMQEKLRTEILRYLLTILSGPLFLTVSEYPTHRYAPLSIFCRGDFPHTATLFASLVNLASNYEVSYFYGKNTNKIHQISSALMILSIAADFHEHGVTNVWNEMLLRDRCDVRKLVAKITAHGNFQDFFPENVCLLWQLQAVSGPTVALTTEGESWLTADLVSSLVEYLARELPAVGRSPTIASSVYMVSFLVLVLSGHREYGTQVDADKLLQTIADNCDEFTAELLLTAGCNVAPYVKNLARETCDKYLRLFDRLVRNYEKEKDADGEKARVVNRIARVVETFNNILQYQFSANRRFVYGLIRTGVGSVRRLLANAELCAEVPGVEVLRTLVERYLPTVERVCGEREVADEEEVLEVIGEVTPVGLLPVPHPISVRSFQWQNDNTKLWLSSFLWGVVFTKSVLAAGNLPLYDWTKIKLVLVTSSAAADDADVATTAAAGRAEDAPGEEDHKLAALRDRDA